MGRLESTESGPCFWVKGALPSPPYRRHPVEPRPLVRRRRDLLSNDEGPTGFLLSGAYWLRYVGSKMCGAAAISDLGLSAPTEFRRKPLSLKESTHELLSWHAEREP
jgi:hypothetical protein